MKVRLLLGNIYKKLFSIRWTCNCCGKEIFSDGYFCESCEKSFPFNNGKVCNHCGRQVYNETEYCLSCKNTYTEVDRARSVFNYAPPVSDLIKKFKFNNKRYLAEIFAKYLKTEYDKNGFNAELIVFPPMTDRAKRKRGFNQTELLARYLSEQTGVPYADNFVKVKETDNQVNLTRELRLKNLIGAYKIVDKKKVKDKTVLILDDVMTTGATTEALAKLLKKAGARKVLALTVASVPSEKAYQ